MGCCISKCRPDNDKLSLEDQLNCVQDKLVISQAAPPTPIPFSSKKISPSPPSPTSSSSSISSFTCTCTTSNSITSSSSLSSASSSALTSKDRSFSNEFLWSCYKENPHIIRINSLKEATHSSMPLPTKSKAQFGKTYPSPPKPSLGLLAPIKQSPPQQQKVAGSSSKPQKRVRSNSPANLTRQKSFRKEPERERPNSAYNYLPSGTLRSPSPSRRFSGDRCGSALASTITVTDSNVSKRMIGLKANNAAHCHSVVSSSLRKESVKPASPNNSSRRLHSGLRHRESCCTYRVGSNSKIDENVVKEVMSDHDMDSALTEDIDNPLISLDCFIFL